MYRTFLHTTFIFEKYFLASYLCQVMCDLFISLQTTLNNAEVSCEYIQTLKENLEVRL